MPSEIKDGVNAVLGEAQEAFKGTDTAAIKAAMEKLATESQKMGRRSTPSPGPTTPLPLPTPASRPRISAVGLMLGVPGLAERRWSPINCRAGAAR